MLHELGEQRLMSQRAVQCDGLQTAEHDLMESRARVRVQKPAVLRMQPFLARTSSPICSISSVRSGRCHADSVQSAWGRLARSRAESADAITRSPLRSSCHLSCGQRSVPDLRPYQDAEI